jgi:diketogulonate reductase-like aldo/keto reductase
MEKLVGDRVRAIGVSNFTITKLQRLLKTAQITPAVNQVCDGSPLVNLLRDKHCVALEG